MTYILRDFKVGDPRDAELLADMWNRSDEAWPGGWTRGIPETGERVLERKRKSDLLAMLVIEHNGEIVGYCDLQAQPGQKEVTHISLLNVRPDHHGRGLGKMLILEMIKRTIDLGYRRLTISTWPGNTKAIPLYKKTGFFWVPETNVFMQNYLPTVFSLPVAKDFFSRHDWYSCFKRDLSVAEDRIEWNGIKVFPYEFEAEGEMLKVVVDVQSEGVTAVETNDYSVACIVGMEEVPAGLDHRVRWELENKTDLPIQVTLIAEGEPGVNLSVQESLELTGKATIERTFSISPDIEPKRPGGPAHKIKTTLIIDGKPLALETAAKAVQPIEIEFDGCTLLPGKREKMTVKLKSNVDFPVDGKLSLSPRPGLEFDRSSADFHLEPKSRCGLVFWTTAREPGMFETELKVGGTGKACDGDFRGLTVRSKPKTLFLCSIPFGGVIGYIDRDEERAVLESHSLRIEVSLRGGWMRVHDKVNGRDVIEQDIGELGPPFVEWRMRPPLYEARLDRRDGCVSVTLVAPSDTFPEVVVEKTIALSAGSVVKVDYRVLNASDEPQKPKLRVNTVSALNGKMALPTKDGVIEEPTGGWGVFPAGQGDLSERPEDYSETWAACEEDGVVAGLIWHECEENEFGWGWMPTLQIDLPNIPPQSLVELAPIYLVTGCGNWETVRGGGGSSSRAASRKSESP